MKASPSLSLSSMGLRASQAASQAKSFLVPSIDRSKTLAPHTSMSDFNNHKSDATRTIPMKLWGDAQLELLANTVLQESGFLSTYDDTMETKWINIKWKLEHSKNHEFVLRLPLWDNLYKQYKTFKRDLLKHYEIKPTTMNTFHLDEEKMPEWAVLIIKMEKYRIATFQYPAEVSRLCWKKHSPSSFFRFIFVSFSLCIVDIIAVSYKGYDIHMAQLGILLLSFLIFVYGLIMVIVYFPTDYPIPPHMFEKHKYVKGTDRDGNLVIQQVTVRPRKTNKIPDKTLHKRGSFFLGKHVTSEIQKISKRSNVAEVGTVIAAAVNGQSQTSGDPLVAEELKETNTSPRPSSVNIMVNGAFNRSSFDEELTAEFEVVSSSLLDRIAIMLLDKDSIVEFLCYLVGFIFIFGNEGVASLRVFRMFRFLSYLKYVDDRYEDDDVPPENRPFSFAKAAKLVSFYMEQLFFEFTTQKSLGGVLLLAIFFFTTYCMALVFWYDRSELITNEGQTCLTLRDCYMTMLRLVFYDGTGFDYLNTLVDTPGNAGYVFLLMLFVIFNGIVLINGLIGIFGATFLTQDDRIEETFKKLHDVDERLSALTTNFEEFEKLFKKNMNLLTKQMKPQALQLHGSHKRTTGDSANTPLTPQGRETSGLRVSRNSTATTRLSEHIKEGNEGDEDDGSDDDDELGAHNGLHMRSFVSDQSDEVDNPLSPASHAAAPPRAALQTLRTQLRVSHPSSVHNLGDDT